MFNNLIKCSGEKAISDYFVFLKIIKNIKINAFNKTIFVITFTLSIGAYIVGKYTFTCEIFSVDAVLPDTIENIN